MFALGIFVLTSLFETCLRSTRECPPANLISKKSVYGTRRVTELSELVGLQRFGFTVEKLDCAGLHTKFVGKKNALTAARMRITII